MGCVYQVQVAEYCEHGNEIPSSIKDEGFLNYLSELPASQERLLHGV
jgi:hypothetical protein